MKIDKIIKIHRSQTSESNFRGYTRKLGVGKLFGLILLVIAIMFKDHSKKDHPSFSKVLVKKMFLFEFRSLQHRSRTYVISPMNTYFGCIMIFNQ